MVRIFKTMDNPRLEFGEPTFAVCELILYDDDRESLLELDGRGEDRMIIVGSIRRHWFDRLVTWLFPRPETWEQAAERCRQREEQLNQEIEALMAQGRTWDDCYPQAREAATWARRRRTFERQANISKRRKDNK